MDHRSKRHIRLPKRQRKLVAVLLGGFLVLLINSLLLYVFEHSTALLYMSNFLLHVVLGILFVLPSIVFITLHLSKMPIRLNWKATGAGIFTAASLLALLSSGFGLVILGSTWAGRTLIYIHLVSVVTSMGGFVVHISMKEGLRYRFLEWGQSVRAGSRRMMQHPLALTVSAGLAVTLIVGVTAWLASRAPDYTQDLDLNPLSGSEAWLAHEGYLNDDDLNRSDSCGQAGCHPDITAQWAQSAHRFSSFNNPYYTKSVEALIERSGNDPARWCASCHDPLVLFSGRFADEVALDQAHPTAQAGLTCLSCHATIGLRDVKGNGRYVMAAPDEYPFARSEAGSRQWIHNTLLKAKPGPHREAMLKPVHQTQEFCGSCHKVGIPPNINNYRWKRGQNEYDAWHNSGTSGNVVRSFYLPDEPKNCVDCHMPLVASDDQGGANGLVRSHAFFAANTALPSLNDHPAQLAGSQDVLRNSASVDVFLVVVNGRAFGPEDLMPTLRANDEVKVTVVVRNRGVGHLLPGGTNDSNEMWLELTARDAEGTPVLESGAFDAQGRVDSTAHFWGTVQVDRASRAIERRNPQDWIATVYANAISPGTAHTVHYGFRVPDGVQISSLEARLLHRKFKWYFHNWTFRGQVAPGEPDSLARPEVDLRRWMLKDEPAPDIPVTVMATARRFDRNNPSSPYPLWERWNDYGIGLLLEEDTRGASLAFESVANLVPDSPEGPINLARVRLSEGQLERAEAALNEAEQREPGYLKTAFFRGEVLKGYGEYDLAIEDWMHVYDEYPNDRVLMLAIARAHYLAGRYTEALDWIDRVLIIDPEDIGALYNRMLSLGALGRTDELAEAQMIYEFYKDDEEELAVTAPYKQRHPMDNREAQPIHTHELLPVRR